MCQLIPIQIHEDSKQHVSNKMVDTSYPDNWSNNAEFGLTLYNEQMIYGARALAFSRFIFYSNGPY